MEKQISIIIPTYNMEAYIGKCLDSLLIPEFDQVEVLVVNDGSKDRSSEIAHSYADRYPNSIRVIDKTNGNYGSCINAALPLCTGRYVKVLDADDTFDTAAFSQFVRHLPRCSEDALITSYVDVNDQDIVLRYHGFKKWKVELDKTYDAELALSRFMYAYIDMHRLLYSSIIFQSLCYHQTEGISYTDTEWAIIPLSSCKSIKCIDIPVYHYLVGREGQTMAPKVLAKNITNLFKILKKLVNHYSNIPYGTIASKIMFSHLRNRHKYVYLQAIQSQSIAVIRELRDYDMWLKDRNIHVFQAVDHIRYYPEIPYNIFSAYRRQDYPYRFTLPLWVRLAVSLVTKLQSKGVRIRF